MELVIIFLIIVGISLPLLLVLECLKVMSCITGSITQGVTIKLALELPPPIEYTRAPEQPEDPNVKKVLDAAQAIQALFLDDDQIFKDTEVK